MRYVLKYCERLQNYSSVQMKPVRSNAYEDHGDLNQPTDGQVFTDRFTPDEFL